MATTFTIDTSEKTIGQLQTIQSKNVILMDTKLNYQILNYDTTLIANNDNVRGLYNAVVLNPETRRIMAVGPPQSVTFDKFKSRVEPILSEVRSQFGITEYKLVLDETTTTPDLQDRNIMYAKIFVKPAKAIEFIAIDFVITQSGVEF